MTKEIISIMLLDRSKKCARLLLRGEEEKTNVTSCDYESSIEVRRASL